MPPKSKASASKSNVQLRPKVTKKVVLQRSTSSDTSSSSADTASTSSSSTQNQVQNQNQSQTRYQNQIDDQIRTLHPIISKKNMEIINGVLKNLPNNNTQLQPSDNNQNNVITTSTTNCNNDIIIMPSADGATDYSYLYDTNAITNADANSETDLNVPYLPESVMQYVPDCVKNRYQSKNPANINPYLSRQILQQHIQNSQIQILQSLHKKPISEITQPKLRERIKHAIATRRSRVAHSMRSVQEQTISLANTQLKQSIQSKSEILLTLALHIDEDNNKFNNLRLTDKPNYPDIQVYPSFSDSESDSDSDSDMVLNNQRIMDDSEDSDSDTPNRIPAEEFNEYYIKYNTSYARNLAFDKDAYDRDEIEDVKYNSYRCAPALDLSSDTAIINTKGIVASVYTQDLKYKHEDRLVSVYQTRVNLRAIKHHNPSHFFTTSLLVPPTHTLPLAYSRLNLNTLWNLSNAYVITIFNNPTIAKPTDFKFFAKTLFTRSAQIIIFNHFGSYQQYEHYKTHPYKRIQFSDTTGNILLVNRDMQQFKDTGNVTDNSQHVFDMVQIRQFIYECVRNNVKYLQMNCKYDKNTDTEHDEACESYCKKNRITIKFEKNRIVVFINTIMDD